MAEKDKLIPTIEGGPISQDGLLELSKKLGIPDNVLLEINKLSPEEKEELEVSLSKIQKEIESGILGLANSEQKVKDTLAGKYGVNIIKNTSNESVDSELKEKEIRDKLLSERLKKVKELDPIVNIELEKVKSTTPVPEDVKLTIAKSSNISPEKIDEVIATGQNPQINNLIDTYYLSQEGLIKSIVSNLPPDKQKTLVFEELRASAREFGLPYTETAQNVKNLILDKSDANQARIVDTVTTLTKSNPDTIVTRSGDTLSWEGTKKGEKYEIDMNVRPPKLSKSLGGLSISYEKQPDNPELEGITEEVKTASNSLAEVKNDTQNKLKNGGFYRDIGKYSTEDLQKFLNNTSVFPNFKEQFQGADINTLQSLQAELSEKVAGATNDMERDILSYMVLAVDGKIKQHEQVKSTGIGELSMISEDEKVAMKHIETLTSQDTRDGLEKYITARKDLEAKQDKLKDIRTPGVEDFDQDASDTLNHLCDIGYDELGQELMDKVIGAVNLKNGWKGYKGEIDLNKKPKLEKMQAQELVSALSRLLNANNQSDNFPTNYSDAYSVLRKNRSQIQQIRKRFEENEQIRKNWKNNETLSKYIYSEKSKSATT